MKSALKDRLGGWLANAVVVVITAAGAIAALLLGTVACLLRVAFVVAAWLLGIVIAVAAVWLALRLLGVDMGGAL